MVWVWFPLRPCINSTFECDRCNLGGFQFLAHGSLNDIQLDDIKDFQKMDHAMTAMGMTNDEKMAIYVVVAAVLHLGNVTFEENLEDSKGKTIGPNCHLGLHTFPLQTGHLMSILSHLNSQRMRIMCPVCKVYKGL